MQDLYHFILAEIRGAWRYKWQGMIAAWAICVLGWLTVFVLPDIYGARAQVFVDADSRLADVIGEVGVEPGVSSRVYIVRQAMLGRPQIEKVAQETGLANRAANAREFDELVTDLQLRIDVETGPTRDTQNLYTITYDDRDRDIAIAVVRTLLETFVDDVLELKEQGTEDVSGYLEDQLEHYSGLLSKAELDLATFKKEHVGLLPGESGDIFDRLQLEMDTLKALQTELRIEEGKRSELRRQLSLESPHLADGGAGAEGPGGLALPGSATDTAIEELESQRASLLLTFTERHPDIIAINEQLEQLYVKQENERAALIADGSGIEGVANSSNPVYQSVQIALNQSSVEIATLQSQIAERELFVGQLNAQVNTIPEVEARYAVLNRDYDQYKTLYDELLVRRERERLGTVGEERDVVTFNIIEPAAAPLNPTRPKRLLLLGAVLLAGIGAGAVLSWGIHQLNPVFTDPKALQEALGRPVIGVVSMTWLDRDRLGKNIDYSTFAVAGASLVVVFVFVLLLREQVVGVMHELLWQSTG